MVRLDPRIPEPRLAPARNGDGAAARGADAPVWQLTLYNGKMDALGSAVQTTGMHKAGVGCAFRTGVPHAVVGGASREHARYTINIFF